MLKIVNVIALLTIMVWPVVPLFWIPVHGLSRIFKRLGLFTYIMPLLLWPLVASLIFTNRRYLLSLRIEMPFFVIIAGLLLTLAGTFLHIWTGKTPWS